MRFLTFMSTNLMSCYKHKLVCGMDVTLHTVILQKVTIKLSTFMKRFWECSKYLSGLFCNLCLSSHFIPRSLHTRHFVHTLVITYPLFGDRNFVLSRNHFIFRLFCTHFGHFIPMSNGYEMTIWLSIRIEVISYHFGHFIPTLNGWMDQ